MSTRRPLLITKKKGLHPQPPKQEAKIQLRNRTNLGQRLIKQKTLTGKTVALGVGPLLLPSPTTVTLKYTLIRRPSNLDIT
jgi:hypothetical protein